MDPVSCLGVIAASLQFLDFGLRTIKVYRTISSDARNAGSYNATLQGHLDRLKGLTVEVSQSVTPSSKVSASLVQVAERCTSRADELAKVIESLIPSQDATVLQKTRAALRSVRNKDKIDRLANELERERDLLASYELAEIRQNLNKISLQQRADAVDARAELDLLSLKLKNELSLIRGEQVATNQLLLDQLQDLSTHVSSLVDVHTQAIITSIDNVQNSMTQGFQQLAIASHTKNVRDALIQSLFFEQQNSRKESLKTPYTDTFNWIFDKDWQDISGSNLHDWLASDSSLYWLQGKAGSGKSTLMRYMVDDARTIDALRNWSGNREIIVASFFFWRPGSTLEKSVVGLLRSILYQLCKQSVPSSDMLVRYFQLEAGNIPFWTESRLLLGVHQLLRMSSSIAYCLFIDGLDEYNGNYLDLLNVLRDIERQGNVKICISSRPEIEFLVHLRLCPQLCLQHLNFWDIQKFVHGVLGGYAGGLDLAEIISLKAEGVFLWAVIVSQYVLRGLISKDKPEVLKQRISALQEPLQDLYSQMLAGVDTVHLDDLKFFLEILKDFEAKKLPYPSVAFLAALRLQDDIFTYEDFVKECERISTQVLACSRGLLQVRETPNTSHHFRLVSAIDVTQNSGNKAVPWTKLQYHLEEAAQSRKLQLSPTAALQEFRRFEETTIDFVHRSAYDFIMAPTGITFLDQGYEHPETFEDQALIAYLRLLVIGPGFGDQFSMCGRYEHLCVYASKMTLRSVKGLPNQKFDLLDRAIAAFQCFHASELITDANFADLFDEDRFNELANKEVEKLIDELHGKRFIDFREDAVQGKDCFASAPVLDYLEYRLALRDGSELSAENLTWIILGLMSEFSSVSDGEKLLDRATLADFLNRCSTQLALILRQAPKLDTQDIVTSTVLLPLTRHRDREFEFSWLRDRAIHNEKQILANIVASYFFVRLNSEDAQFASVAALLEDIVHDLDIYISIAPPGIFWMHPPRARRCARLSLHLSATVLGKALGLDPYFCQSRKSAEDGSSATQPMRLIAWIHKTHEEDEKYSLQHNMVCYQDLDLKTTVAVTKHLNLSALKSRWRGSERCSLKSTRQEFQDCQLALTRAVLSCKRFDDGWHQLFMVACINKRLAWRWAVSNPQQEE